jgi:hypothetical protein
MATYKVNDKFAAKYPNAVTLVDGVGVAICGKDLEIETPGTAQRPPSKRVIKAATQAQLKYLYDTEKHPAIEVVTEPTAKS